MRKAKKQLSVSDVDKTMAKFYGLEDFKKDFESSQQNYEVRPSVMQMQLEQFRKMAVSDDMGRRQELASFLEEVKDVTGEAIVVITAERLSLLTDEEGNLLSFR